MKHLIVFFFFCFFLEPFLVLAISAESYVVMDFDSGRVLMGKDYEKEKLIASTTKIMTAIIALENGDLESKRVVQEEVLKAYGSAIYLSLGEEITLKDLLFGLMLRSGNDAAIEIAYHVSGNMENFVTLMNQKAYELGMSHTFFLNNHGLENEKKEGNVSTAYDMALLMRYALKNSYFREIIATKNYTAKTSLKTYSWKNKNRLLFLFPYALGGKTGFTEKARRTLVTASLKDEKTCIVVTLNDGNDFSDHKELCEKVFASYRRYLLLDKDSFVLDESDPKKYYIKDNFYALLTEEERKKIQISYEVQSDSKEEEVGVAFLYLDQDLLGTVKIYQRKEEKTVTDSFWHKFWRWLFGW